MELLFVTVIGAGIGYVLRYVIPGRHGYGVLLLPFLSATVTAAVWVGLVWAGFRFDGGWIWVISIASAVLVSALVAGILPRRRRSADARSLDTLLARRA